MKVLIAAGGSGGHIFPAIALARCLEKREGGTEILFVGSRKELDRRIFEKEKFNYRLISQNKMPCGISVKIAPFALRLFADMARSFFVLLSFRPNVVVGFGGYVSWPVTLCASVLRIRKVVHEQNVVPGRANDFLFNLADSIALSFGRTSEFLGCRGRKAVVTGNPIRDSMFKNDREAGVRRFGLSRDKFTILVIGGSQGARSINETFVKAISGLDPEKKKTIQVIHITGIKDYEEVSRAYGETGVENRTYSFIDRIEDAYSASDLVITRSGASAIFEIAFFGRPMVLVPYPFAHAHQSENARVFSEGGAAVVIEEKSMTAENFCQTISALINDRARLGNMARSAKKLSAPDAADLLADIVLDSGDIK